VLFRPRYRGEIVWNQTKRCDRWGQHRASDRRENEWVCVPAPHLRIVPEELWQAAHARIAASRSAMNLYRGRGSASRYLLPGLARCAWCQGGMYVRTRTRANGADLRMYGCSSHYHRGETVCGNATVVPMEVTDRAVLAKIGDLLTPDLAEDVIGRLRELADAQAATDPRTPVEAELAGVETQIARLTEAIAMGGGGAMPTLVQRLQDLEQRRQVLAEALDSMPGPAPLPRVDWPVLAREARRMLQQWRDLLGDDVGDTRRVLRELLDGPLRFTPMVEGARRGYRFEGSLTIGGILAGSARSFEWRPRAESNCRPSA
jgi:site-specific DNA recombinase